MTHTQVTLTCTQIKFDNEWYKNDKQIKITSAHAIKDRFNAKQLENLEGDIITFPSINKSTKLDQNFPNL